VSPLKTQSIQMDNHNTTRLIKQFHKKSVLITSVSRLTCR
jgi:hypothetical protein